MLQVLSNLAPKPPAAAASSTMPMTPGAQDMGGNMTPGMGFMSPGPSTTPAVPHREQRDYR